jgi:hypothetical protein
MKTSRSRHANFICWLKIFRLTDPCGDNQVKHDAPSSGIQGKNLQNKNALHEKEINVLHKLQGLPPQIVLDSAMKHVYCLIANLQKEEDVAQRR